MKQNTKRDARTQKSSLPKTGEQKLTDLSTISDLITQSLDNREVLELASDKIQEVMEADAILAFLLDDKSKNLILQLYKGVSEDFANGIKKVKVGDGFNGKVASTGEPLLVDDVSKNPLSRNRAVVNEGLKSQIITPLKSKGKVVGTLCAARRTRTGFTLDEVGLLSSIGNQIGATLENARLYREMEQTLSRLKQSEERYRDLFENASDAVWMHDLNGKTLAANQACEKVTGYSEKELSEMPVDMLMDLFGKSCIENIEQGLLNNQPIDHRCEVRLDKKNGNKAVVEITTSLISHEGKITGFQHAARDVTDERQMQENLRFYLQQVTRAQEEERKRIARELHDETLQNLIVISRQMEKITSSEALWEESIGVVRSLKKQIETAVQEMRRFSHDLRPSVLDDLGLLPALELLTDDLEKSGITTKFKVIGEAHRLTPESEVMLFRIAQEATRNIWRHANASTAELSIEFAGSQLKMSIKDNGKGFRLSPQPIGLRGGTGKFGLTGMRERARLLNGTLTVDSRNRKGTTIIVEVRI